MASNGTTNLPVLFYSSALLLVLRMQLQLQLQLARDQQGGGGEPAEKAPAAAALLGDARWASVLEAVCWIPLLATLWGLSESARRWLRWQWRRRRRRQRRSSTRNGSSSSSCYSDDDDNNNNDNNNNNNNSNNNSNYNSNNGDDDVPRWALVTGASQGIGRAIASALVVERGIPVVAVARNAKALDGLRSELEGTGNNSGMVVPIVCDISDRSDVDRLLETLATMEVPFVAGRNENDYTYENNSNNYNDNYNGNENENDNGFKPPPLPKNQPKLLDHIDILVNNAGAGDCCDFFRADDESGLERLHELMALNVVGTTHLTHRLGRKMKQNTNKNANKNTNTNTNASNSRSNSEDAAGCPRHKRIVIVSSIMGVVPGNAGCTVYAATKAYQRSFCASLARELELELSLSGQSDSGHHPLSVTCVLPGAVGATGFGASSNMQDAPVFWLPVPGLVLTPEGVASAAIDACLRPLPPREVVVGVVYQLVAFWLVDWLPRRTAQVLGELLARPWKLGAVSESEPEYASASAFEPKQKTKTKEA